VSSRNALSRVAVTLARLPRPLRVLLQTAILRFKVPFVGTARLKIIQLSSDRVIVTIANRRRVRNHIGGVHAAAMALLAETCSGFAVAMYLPDSKIPLVRTMTLNYVARASGGLRAVATLRPEDISAMQSEERGRVSVRIVVTDDKGVEPVQCEVVWAWVPRVRAPTDIPAAPT
jgi:acyl-coenzyme A thioesterase PaaI-like protein